MVQFVSLFTTEKKVSFDRPKNDTPIQVFHKRRQQIRFYHFFLCNFNPIRRLHVTRKPVYRSSGVQISRDICTRSGLYMYSTKYGVQLDNKDTYSFEPSLCIHLLSDMSNYLSSRYPFPDLYEAPAILLYDRVSKLKTKN